LLDLSRGKAHLISREAFVIKVSFPGEKVEERLNKLVDASNFFADRKIKLVKSLIAHSLCFIIIIQIKKVLE